MKRYNLSTASLAIMLASGTGAWASLPDDLKTPAAVTKSAVSETPYVAPKAVLDKLQSLFRPNDPIAWADKLKKYSPDEQLRVLDNMHTLKNAGYIRYVDAGEIESESGYLSQVNPEFLKEIAHLDFVKSAYPKSEFIWKLHRWSNAKALLNPCPGLGRKLTLLLSLAPNKQETFKNMDLIKFYSTLPKLSDRIILEEATALGARESAKYYSGRALSSRCDMLAQLAEYDQNLLLATNFIDHFNDHFCTERCSNNNAEASALFNPLRPGLLRLQTLKVQLTWQGVKSVPELLVRLGETPDNIWREIAPLVNPNCEVEHLELLLKELGPSSLPKFLQAKELGHGKKWGLGAYLDTMRWLGWYPISTADFQLLRDSFADRHDDDGSKVIMDSIRSLSQPGYRLSTISAIAAIRDHGKKLSDTHAWVLLEYLHNFDNAKQSNLVQRLPNHPDFPGWIEMESYEGRKILSSILTQLNNASVLEEMLEECPLGIHPASWNPRQIVVKSSMLPPEQRPIVVFDIDSCMQKGSQAIDNVQEARKEFQSYMKEHPHTVTWTCKYRQNKIALHRVMPYFPAALEAMIRKGWRVAYFSSGPEDRNKPFIEDTHKLFFGADVYEELKQQGQFQVWSRQHVKDNRSF